MVCIRLSVWLAAGGERSAASAGYDRPIAVVIVLIYNIYLLGQPNLFFWLFLLGSFACLRLARPLGRGHLLATAAASRRSRFWYSATWSTAEVDCLGRDGRRTGRVALEFAPLPFRTPVQAVDDLVVWSTRHALYL